MHSRAQPYITYVRTTANRDGSKTARVSTTGDRPTPCPTTRTMHGRRQQAMGPGRPGGRGTCAAARAGVSRLGAHRGAQVVVEGCALVARVVACRGGRSVCAQPRVCLQMVPRPGSPGPVWCNDENPALTQCRNKVNKTSFHGLCFAPGRGRAGAKGHAPGRACGAPWPACAAHSASRSSADDGAAAAASCSGSISGDDWLCARAAALYWC